MEYWEGAMNWPLAADWICETCGLGPGDGDRAKDEHSVLVSIWGSLTWGIVHATCRCNRCHTQYRMRDAEGEVVTTPICNLKPEYQEPAKWAWKEWGEPIDELSDYKWDKAISAVKLEVTLE